MDPDNPKIIERGRGPEIEGTRITVYDVMDYAKEGWSAIRIAVLFDIGSLQVKAALKYIDEHRAEVEADYAKILARSARGNPPEVQARQEESRRRFAEMVRLRRGRRSA